MSVFLLVVALCLWVIAVVCVGMHAAERESWVLGFITILIIAAPFGIGASLMGTDDPHANQLCARGHETWVTWRRPAALVGRVFIPAREVTEKMWICEVWEP